VLQGLLAYSISTYLDESTVRHSRHFATVLVMVTEYTNGRKITVSQAYFGTPQNIASLKIFLVKTYFGTKVTL
jgi:hypothetical protein